MIAFYAAVHYVNAYLWEMDNHYSPENHRERAEKIDNLPDLRLIRAHYRRLNRLGYNARYNETYRLNLSTAQSALADLQDIEAQIRPRLQ